MQSENAGQQPGNGTRYSRTLITPRKQPGKGKAALVWQFDQPGKVDFCMPYSRP